MVTPDAVKDDRYAAVIILDGIFCGILTGWALKNFIGDPHKGKIVDYLHARKIINGLDKADLVLTQFYFCCVQLLLLIAFTIKSQFVEKIHAELALKISTVAINLADL